LVFRELLHAAQVRLPSLTVYTASMEVASLLYYQHQGAGADVGGLWIGDTVFVDRTEGALVPDSDESPIDTAVISYHAIYHGMFYSKANDKTHEFSRRFLQRA